MKYTYGTAKETATANSTDMKYTYGTAKETATANSTDMKYTYGTAKETATATSTDKEDTTDSAEKSASTDKKDTSVTSVAIKPTTNIAVKPPTDFIAKPPPSITIKPSSSITIQNEPLKDKTNVDQATEMKIYVRKEMLSSMKSIYDENKMIEPEKEVPIAPINAEKKRKMLEVTTAEPDNAKKPLPGRIATSSVESPNIIESTAFGPTVSYNLHKCLCRECREVVDTVTWKLNQVPTERECYCDDCRFTKLDHWSTLQKSKAKGKKTGHKCHACHLGKRRELGWNQAADMMLNERAECFCGSCTTKAIEKHAYDRHCYCYRCKYDERVLDVRAGRAPPTPFAIWPNHQ